MAGDDVIPGLSPTDSMLVAGVRAGRLDAESAVRLGLTVTDVRQRLDAVVSRLGFAGRGELRSWDPALLPYPALVADEALMEDEPAPVTEQTSGGTRRVPVASLAGLALVALLVGAALWWFAGDTSPEVVATANSAPAAAAASSVFRSLPLTFSGVPLTRLTPLPASDLEPGLALYALVDCDCGRPVQEFVRLYKGSDGAVHRDTLFRADAYAGDPVATIGWAWAEGDASDIAVAVCVEGECGAERRLAPLAARTMIWRSRDGGITWNQAGPPLIGLVSILGASDGQLIIRLAHPATPDSPQETYLRYPGGERISQPPGGRYPSSLFTFGEGRLAWLSGSDPVVIGSTGGTLLGLTDPAARPFSRAVPRTRTAESWALSWYPESPTPDQLQIFTGIAETDSAGVVRKALVYSGLPVTPLLWLDAHTVLASVSVSVPLDFPGPPGASNPVPVPALVDFDAETLTPLIEPLSILGRNRVVAAWRGDIVRIGDVQNCVPVLEESEPLSNVQVACLPARSIVDLLGARNYGPEFVWLYVRTASGKLGWIFQTAEIKVGG